MLTPSMGRSVNIETDTCKSKWRALSCKYRMLVSILTVGLTLGVGYIYWFTPLPVLVLDKLNLRRFFLPNIQCHNCTNIDFNYVIRNDSQCDDRDLFLLNVVVSFHPNVQSRNAIRETWGGVRQYKGVKIKTIFAFGIHSDDNFNKVLLLEQEKYNDILQFDLPEDYKKLTEKTIMVMKWFHKHCSRVKFILKTDDDSFNNIPRILDYLLHVKQDKFVGGYCWTVMPDRRKDSKYYVGESVYPDVYYPTYCAGPGYIMNQGAVEAVLNVYNNVIYLTMEDVFIAGLCRVAAGIMYSEIPGMIVGNDQLSACDMATWAKNTHNIFPERMRDLWRTAVNADSRKDCLNRNFRRVVFYVIGILLWMRMVAMMLVR